MSKVRLTGSNSGYVEIAAVADAGNLSFTMPTHGTALIGNGNNVYTGISTFNGATFFNDDVTFDGATAGYDVVWDRSDNQLEFATNAKATFGDAMQIYHDGNNSLIQDSGTGHIQVRSGTFTVANAGLTKTSAVFNSGSGQQLNFNNNQKFITTNTGVVVTGICTATSFSGSVPSSNLTGASPAIDGSALTGISSPTANRNFIINGAMRIWQRGTSFNSQGNGQNDYTTDRFAIGHNNSHMAAVTQQDGTGAHAKFQYCARVQRDSGQSQTDQMRFHTALETNDVILLRGEVLTISYYARKGANYSEANSKITGVRIATGENTDGDPNAYSGGHWTNSTTILTGTPTLTTSWQRFSHTTSAVSNSANSMIIEFRHTPTGTAGANDYYEITGVQLEIGSSMTAFEHRKFAEEKKRCERYYQTYGFTTMMGYMAGQIGTPRILFPTEMRNTPAVTVEYGSNGNGTFRNQNDGSTLTGNTVFNYYTNGFDCRGNNGSLNIIYSSAYKADAEL